MAGNFPRALHKGDTIALISPSARLNLYAPVALGRGISFLKSLGFEVKTVFSEYPEGNTFASRTLHRASEVNAAFTDSSIAAVICTLGGSHVNELLPHLDYGAIRANPKIFVGYSDITALHFALFTQANLRTFYGPCALCEFAENPKPFELTASHFLDVLQPAKVQPLGPVPRSNEWTDELSPFLIEPDSLKLRALHPTPPWKWLRQGTIEGRLMGGCMEVIMQLRGTKYWPDMNGRILLLETAMGEEMLSPWSLDAVRTSMADLLNMGVLHQIVGIVIGRCYGYSTQEGMEEEFHEIILDFYEAAGATYPVLYGIDVGHTDPTLTIPLNALVRLDSASDEFSILEPGVRG